ncbi:universal stress protein [Noviherbaspirillum sp.]|uniref:universal stress protein n=1 Tax=Noviherbaspirillum sp. TaxID=1926288 RepID=UPI002D5C77F2|nr:universal stress protein [Noviherbaspirillum sp.]HZW23483.1 universal stress protein [Noviherbaspirillum sp.]
MFHSILWPVDGSAMSFKPLQEVIDLAKLSGGKIVVLSIAQPRLFYSTEPGQLQDGKAAEEKHLEAARESVQKVREIGRRAGVECESIVSMSHIPGDAILETVQKTNCDLIVMATRGRMGVVDTLFKESTTQDVLRRSPVPVLVFPSQGEGAVDPG